MDNKEEKRKITNNINLMPEGANEEDYKGFKFKLFRVVPENVAVIRKGWITGRITGKEGFRCIRKIWHRSKRIR